MRDELGQSLFRCRAALSDLQAEAELARLVSAQAGDRVDVLRQDLLRRLFGDLLDLDAALGRGHDRDPALLAIDDQAEVELARDVEALLDVEPTHLLAFGAGLVRDELHAEHLLGDLARLGAPPFTTLTPPPLPRPPAWI